MELGNNVALKGVTPNIRNISITCYTATLISGITLLRIPMKIDTLRIP